MTALLSPAEAALLDEVAALLLPGGDGVPGAAGMSYEAALAAEPLLRDPVRAALTALADHPGGLPAAVADLTARPDPAGDALLLVVLATYYGRTDVRRAIGYPGPLAVELPSLPDERDAVLDPLLDRVRMRGPRYRDISPS